MQRRNKNWKKNCINGQNWKSQCKGGMQMEKKIGYNGNKHILYIGTQCIVRYIFEQVTCDTNINRVKVKSNIDS